MKKEPLIANEIRDANDEVRDAKNNEVHDVPNKARQVCERRRESEAAVS